MGTQVVHAEKLSTSRKGTNGQMDKQGSEKHVCIVAHAEKMQKNGERKLVLEWSDPEQNQKVGDKSCEALLQIQN